jgi:SAM-dependent methyltransferase
MHGQNSTYYQKVADYYDEDSRHFENRRDANDILEFIRSDFRSFADSLEPESMLEIGCGTGTDLVYFLGRDYTQSMEGMDISPEMAKISDKNVQEAGFDTRIHVGSVEDIPLVCGDRKFKMIYVFFGALNTVEDLDRAAALLYDQLENEGHLLLTFVNKWYMLGILKPLLKLKFTLAFRRLKKVWGGYSLDRFLPSKARAPKEIISAFGKDRLIKRKGYSILYPAWYEFEKYRDRKKSLEKRWAWDQRLNRTPLWSWGEYGLYLFKK